MTMEEYTKRLVELYNSTEGNLNELDGYDCKECQNRGNFAKALVDDYGDWFDSRVNCSCVKIRKSIHRLKKSGLENVMKLYTFDNYRSSEDWQDKIKKVSQKYAENHANSWFFLGGQSGAGKTHLCTAIASKYLDDGNEVRYMLWKDETSKIKKRANDLEGEDIVEEFKKCDVLYIDDLFKPGKDQNGNPQRPSTADIQIAFEILNYRYTRRDGKSITIISSERSIEELLDIDEAVGSRIVEMSFCRGYGISIDKDSSKNYRLKDLTRI